jgi:hypothetical protein
LHEFFEEFDQGMRLATADYIEYTGEGVIERRLDYVICIIVKCSTIFEPQWPANFSNLKGCQPGYNKGSNGYLETHPKS